MPKALITLLVVATVLAAPVPAGAAPSGSDRPGVVRGEHWLLRDERSSGHATTSFRYGGDGVPVFGDWDGDGRATPGWFDDGVWYLRNSNSAGPPARVLRFGSKGDIPVVGDWIADSAEFDDHLGVVRRSSRGWHWFIESDSTDDGRITTDGRANASFYYGSLRDTPVSGVWEFDTCFECNPAHHVAVIRRTSRGLRWLFETDYDRDSGRVTSDGKHSFDAYFGSSNGDVPIVGDWNDDEVDDVGVVRGNRWLLERQSRDTGSSLRTASDGRHDVSFRYGRGGDHFGVWQVPRR